MLHELPDSRPMAAVQPKVVGVLVDHQNLRGEGRDQNPLPFAENALARAHDGGNGMALAAQLAQQAEAPYDTGVVIHVVNAGRLLRQSVRSTVETRDQIDGHAVAELRPDAWNHRFGNVARAALNQQNTRGHGNVAA